MLQNLISSVDAKGLLKRLIQEVTLDSAAIRSANQVGGAVEIANNLTIQKSVKASTVRARVTRVSPAVRCVVWITVLMFANFSSVSFAQTESSCQGIHVNILNIRNSTGTVACALFESPEGFPTEFLASATNIMIIKIRKTQARCDFLDIPPGKYAMAVIHDENRNGKLDTNWMGVPKEGYGFSDQEKAVRGAPSFSAASFIYDGQSLNLTMTLYY